MLSNLFVTIVEVPSNFIRCALVLKCTIGPCTAVAGDDGKNFYKNTTEFHGSIRQSSWHLVSGS